MKPSQDSLQSLPCRTRFRLFAFFWFFAAVLPARAADSEAQLTLPPGIAVDHVHQAEIPRSIRIVSLERNRADFTITTALANDMIFGINTVSDQVRRLSSPPGWEPLLAINGDFFRIRFGPYRGDPLGLLIQDGELISSPTSVGFWVDEKNRPRIGSVRASFRAILDDDQSIPIGLNAPRADDNAMLYTPTLGQTTRTYQGLDLILKPEPDSPWLPLQAGVTYHARIGQVHEGGNAPLHEDSMVLSIGPELAAHLPVFAAGDPLDLVMETEPALHGAPTAIGGGPILLRDGEITPSADQKAAHPRTAIGFNDTHYFFVVVDGRQPDWSIGMTLPELARFMRDLGCTDALNLDGGGSTTLWLQGAVRNRPSDGSERRVGNSILVLHRP